MTGVDLSAAELVLQWKAEGRTTSEAAHPAGNIDLPLVDAMRSVRDYHGADADGTWGCWTFTCSNLVCTLADSCTAVPTYDGCTETV